MKKNEGRLVGILGTVIIHLIAGIIFMSFKIKSLEKDQSEEFEMEFAAVKESELKEKLTELPSTSVERILRGDEEMLNIARNLANKADAKINPADYIDRVKEELIKSGKLGINNYFGLFTGRFGQNGRPTFSNLIVTDDTITVATYEISDDGSAKFFDKFKVTK